MLIFLGLFIFSMTIAINFFYPYSIFSTKQSNGASVFFTLLFMLFSLVVTISVGEYLARIIGKNLPTYQYVVKTEYVSSLGNMMKVVEYKPVFKSWKYYLMALPSNGGVRGNRKVIEPLD